MTIYKLGAQLEGGLGSRDKWLVPERAYHIPLRWDEVELTQGTYTFPAWVFETITQMDNKLGHDSYQLVIGLKCTPTFYSLPPHARNSPPAPAHYADYARFADAVAMTFNPYALELWNEPEFSVSESNPEYYGGFGLDGKSYGEMVRITHDYLHTHNIETKVMAGASFGLVNVARALQFLRDAVQAGMKSDYWSWHGYVWDWQVWSNTKKFRDLLKFSWDAEEIYPVPQIISETSVIRKATTERKASRDRQAELMEFLIQHQSATNIESIWWYTLADNPWMKCSFVMGDTAYPAYDVWSEA